MHKNHFFVFRQKSTHNVETAKKGTHQSMSKNSKQKKTQNKPNTHAHKKQKKYIKYYNYIEEKKRPWVKNEGFGCVCTIYMNKAIYTNMLHNSMRNFIIRHTNMQSLR